MAYTQVSSIDGAAAKWKREGTEFSLCLLFVVVIAFGHELVSFYFPLSFFLFHFNAGWTLNKARRTRKSAI